MATNVGNQNKFIDAIKELIELDYDAVDTYKLAIEKLKNLEYKDKFYEFKAVRITSYPIYEEGANFSFRVRNSMNSRQFELLYIKFTRNKQTLRFALGISGIPCSLN